MSKDPKGDSKVLFYEIEQMLPEPVCEEDKTKIKQILDKVSEFGVARYNEGWDDGIADTSSEGDIEDKMSEVASEYHEARLEALG